MHRVGHDGSPVGSCARERRTGTADVVVARVARCKGGMRWVIAKEDRAAEVGVSAEVRAAEVGVAVEGRLVEVDVLAEDIAAEDRLLEGRAAEVDVAEGRAAEVRVAKGRAGKGDDTGKYESI